MTKAAPKMPTDEEFKELIKPIWLATKPGYQAQFIRAELSTEFDDPRFPQWVSDYMPGYIWDLIDIAAQRGLNAQELKPKNSAPISNAGKQHD